MSRNLINLLIAAAFIAAVAGCFCRSDRTFDSPIAPAVNSEANPPPVSEKKDKKKDEGDFIVQHLGVSRERYVEIDRQIKSEKLLEKAADKLNRSLILPYDVYLRTKDCGEVNAFFDPNDHSVLVCYELMEHFFQVFRSDGNPPELAYDKMFDAVRFVFLHEIGHALIDTYRLPIAGNEEDAADRCSSYINLEELADDGVRAVFAAADAFNIESRQKAGSGRNMADEHLLQEQRFYNSLCMIYGSNTSKYEHIVTDGYLPKERAVRCPAEYQRTVEAWVDLLGPWRKK